MAIKDTLPPVKPTLLLDFANSKTLDPRITFTRASTATYYDGKTFVKAEENLFAPSVNIGAPYQNAANALTNNVGTAPDGSPTASLLVPTSAAVRHYCSSPLGASAQAGATMTASVHVKSAGYGFAFLMLAGSTGTGGSRYGVTVNLSTGAIGGYSAASNVSGQSAAVSDLGGGWYRVALTANLSLSVLQPVMYVQSMPTDGTAYVNGGDFLPVYAGNGVDGGYFWGFQLEQRATVTAYTPTTLAPITNYLPQLMTAPAGVPRFDHCPISGRCLGLLIEEQRANLLSYSDRFDQWTNASGTVSSNVAVAPDGLLSADLVQGVRYVAVSLASGTRTFSCCAKKVDGDGRFTLRIDTPTSIGAVFDLSTGTVVNSDAALTASIAHVGNGYYRCAIAYTGAITNVVLITASLGLKSSLVWGAQLEAGAFATSYIPTTSAAVTRQADSAAMVGANFTSWFSAGEGTILYNTAPGNHVIDGRVAWQLDNGVSGYLQIMYAAYSVGGNYYPPTVVPAGQTSEGPNRNAFAYNTISSAVCSNGFSVSAVSANYSFGSAARFIFCGMRTPVKKMAFYPKKLTNTQLQAITL
jgi:hypothetical protein